ncbi:MAG: ABC transporter permease [Gaiellales bacterium]|jgi:spermidine/putrescine transport system permease protein
MAAGTEVTEATGTQQQAAPSRKAPSRFWAKVRYQLLNVYAGLAFLYLLVPIAVVILFSFNDPPGRFNFTWHKFSTAAWQHPFATPGIESAVVLSLKIAFLSTIIATILGTLMALALARYSFRGRSVTNFVIFLPMATPEIVMGSSLLTLFISISFNRGITTILIAHIMFNISYVVVTVKARIYGFDRRMEEAAMDLYANEFTTFRKITLPLIMPGVLAAALLAFALSIDDFVITQFNAGPDITFPLFIYGAARTGVPVQVNVIGSMIFLVAIGLMAVNILYQNYRGKRDALAVRGAVRKAQLAEAT